MEDDQNDGNRNQDDMAVLLLTGRQSRNGCVLSEVLKRLGHQG